MGEPQTLYCSFCGKSQHEVKRLIAGPVVFICDECILACLKLCEDLPDFRGHLIGECQHRALLDMMGDPSPAFQSDGA